MESLFGEQVRLAITGYQSKVIICDTNTEKHCLPVLTANADISDFILITIPFGEGSKTLSQCSDIINQLILKQIDTRSVIINLGGGVVSDIGGFIASIYKRGIDYINIPTSLLAMVDASIGGKTGVDFNNIKNIVGTFKQPKSVITNIVFLDTLPLNERFSGVAEMLKYGIIADPQLLNKLISSPLSNLHIDDILKCQNIKSAIVSSDPFDKGERKKLNFGHTFGHAFEAFFMQAGKPITHGHAVAMGIIGELYLSTQLTDYPIEEYNKISNYIQQTYPPIVIQKTDFDTITGFMLNDKKNSNNAIYPILIDNLNNCILNYNVDLQTINKALSIYCR